MVRYPPGAHNPASRPSSGYPELWNPYPGNMEPLPVSAGPRAPWARVPVVLSPVVRRV